VPRPGGTPSFTAGPRVANVDRIVFNVVSDAATAAAALQTGDADWVEQPLIDLLPVLGRSREIAIEIKDRTGMVGCFRFNHLHPPFDNAAIRRVVLQAVNQADCMTAVAGVKPDYWQDDVGYFPPGSPLAARPGFGRTEPGKMAGLRGALAAAGYKGERVVFLSGADVPRISAICEVMRDTLTQIGMNVDFVTTDWGTVLSRINAGTRPPRAAGAATARIGRAWTNGCRRPTPSCALAVPAVRPAGRTARTWRRCAPSGWQRAARRLSARSGMNWSRRPSRPSHTCRWGCSASRSPTGAT